MPFLDWVNKNQAKGSARKVPYHLLNREAKYGDASAAAHNLIIQGDNLLALKALVPFYAGRVKCIFIDPPYNTQSAFEHYDDRLEHSQWLSMMYPRLALLRDLLAEDGSIWVTIDDSEAHYLKVLMDEVFGRKNFIASNVWQKRYSRENREAIGDVHDYVMVYAKSPDKFKETRNRIPLDEAQAKIYRNPDNPKETDPTKRWRGLPMTAQGFRTNQMYTITAPNGREHKPTEGRCWSMIEPEFQKLLAQGRIYWGKDGNAQPSVIRFLSEVEGLVPWTWWPHEEVGHTDEAKKESNVLFGADVAFGTPKPERLMARILHIASNPGDLVLDSFLGSGTTAAVAHKMGRRYIGIEMGEHARTHCIPRLEKVIAGEQGGISETEQWKGGGGFSFCTLGESAFDEHGRLNADVKFSTLAAYIWHLETGTAGKQTFDSPFLGVHEGKAYFLLYNGILGDRRPAGGNVLNSAILAHIRTLWASPMPVVVYGETARVGPARLAAEAITFRQIPYDISMR
ncbi:site-specific DNA-methyltransferase [Burkholderia stagnalis]|uniref:site-specific DNA-methyltransferase n=1 Tax=Burkholderia stagnalis TaxID=1503054 RepID=UPI000F5B8438|nr:site-specific DNA-methyltransferase [Burkholderia stagnalis]RQQ29890.1 site-specific DNA-methyltransferase [Burkholderia stagnalis]RQQ95218.1 site-specific DNA-methyltransferase [Burkholderia stagnalis]RQX86179.1 site-specific DNA-methyltransferase [Burkholderia stagnalis]